MKLPRLPRWSRLLPLLLAAACLAPALPAARGQQVFWDPALQRSPNSGGSGTWIAGTPNWYDQTVNSDNPYPNGSQPIFAGAAGTVTLSGGGLTATALTFGTAGYVVQDATGTAYALTTTFVGTTAQSGTDTVNVPLTLSSNPQLRAVAGNTLSLGGTLTTTAAVTVGNSGSTGTVSLAGNNGFSAGINVTFGMLTAASNTALGTGNVSLAGGTTLTLNPGVALANETASTLTLASATTSQVNLLGNGVQDTVAALVINNVAQPPGTYGAAGSGAAFPMPDFTGPGELLVVPEPSARALLGLGGAGLLGLALRQRRSNHRPVVTSGLGSSQASSAASWRGEISLPRALVW